jgi:plasmid stabilization system protein ParE
MAYKIVISPLAYIDEYEAYEWYEIQSAGLGERFLSTLEIAYNKIAQNPEYCGFIDDNKELRDYLVYPFPFLIVYRINGDTIEVITVHHAKKHPDKKYGNTQQ